MSVDLKSSLDRAVSLGANCESCPLKERSGPVYFKTKAQDPIHGFDITFVAKRPDYTDLAQKAPMSSGEGWLLQKLMKESHIKWPEVHVSYSTLCTSHTILKKPEWAQAINCCRPRLANEIGEPRKPMLVFLLGTEALLSVTGKDSIKAWRGYPLKPLELYDNTNTVYFPIYHPETIRRDAAYASVWKLDFQRALAYMAGKLKPVPWPETYVDDDENTLSVLEDIYKEVERKPTWLGTDVETAGIEPLLVKMLCMSVSTRDRAVCLPTRSKLPETFPLWKRLMEHKNALLVAHNGIHDQLSYELHGIYCRIAYDTLAAARVAYPRLDHDLGSVATYHHFIPRHKSQYRKSGDADSKGEASWEKSSLDQGKFHAMRVYCARDSFTGFICKEPLERILESCA